MKAAKGRGLYSARSTSVDAGQWQTKFDDRTGSSSSLGSRPISQTIFGRIASRLRASETRLCERIQQSDSLTGSAMLNDATAGEEKEEEDLTD